MAGIFAVGIVAAGILVLYNYNANSKQEINIKVEKPKNDIKEIKNPRTGMITSDEEYIQQIADVFSQLEIEYTGKIKKEKEIYYDYWGEIEFRYNNSDKIKVVSIGGPGEKLCVEGEEYTIKNDNRQELNRKFQKLMYYISEDMGQVER